MEDLYQEIILDHNKRPRNYREMPACTCSAEGNNPLCGDEVKVFVQLDGEKLSEVAFQGQGCAISRASASMMTGKTKGRTASGVRKFPARIKCAMLPWHTLEAALDGQASATTESGD